MPKKTKQLQVSEQSLNKVMIQCRTLVNKNAVTRKSIDGDEHIIVSSSTLPDDVVMNGGLYPADEIEKSFETLELTLAPIEHPHIDGNFIPASDPRAIHAFHAGAYNMNVRRENGRVHIDKYIKVSEAMKTDRGKRLLDRINELESNEKPRPIHTSVGVFVAPEQLSEPMTNASGDEYNWIARDMLFDHDAILLDSVGAAQPHQGVGVAVNSEGKECNVDSFEIAAEEIKESESQKKLNSIVKLFGNVEKSNDSEKQRLKNSIDSYFNEIKANAIGLSFNDITMAIDEELNKRAMITENDYLCVIDVYPEDETAVYELNGDLFTVPYLISDQGQVTIVGIPLRVERNVAYIPKTNSEGNAMKDLVLNALKEAGVDTEGMDDHQLIEAYNKIQANQSDSDDNGANDDNGIAEVVANAVSEATKPFVDQVQSLQAQLNSAGEAELNKLAGIVANSGKYPSLDAESAKLLGVDKLKEMAANCQPAYGLSPVANQFVDTGSSVPADMPE